MQTEVLEISRVEILLPAEQIILLREMQLPVPVQILSAVVQEIVLQAERAEVPVLPLQAQTSSQEDLVIMQLVTPGILRVIILSVADILIRHKGEQVLHQARILYPEVTQTRLMEVRILIPE